jgi:myo-inositol-1(or 4)-monophosphatase
MDLLSLRSLLEKAARDGGELAMPFFRNGRGTVAAVSYKDEGSPVTEADIAVDRFLERTLKKALPDYGWLSEESVDNPARLSCERVIIVDPIDGTRGFVAGEDTWCVSIGVIEKGVPIAGALYVPARQELFLAAKGLGATLNGKPLPIRPSPRPFTFAGPASVIEKALPHHKGPMVSHRRVPSLAYRLALLPRGDADAAAATRACHDWDIAAVDVILSESGFRLQDLDGQAPIYNRAKPVHPALFATWRDQ